MNGTLRNANAWAAAYHALCDRLPPRCSRPDCQQNGPAWKRLRRRRPGVVFQNEWYCLEGCLERPLIEALRRARTPSQSFAQRHRIPLGLLLISRQQLTVSQLRAALAAQHSAGYGRIGEWLQHLGFSSEQQITAALARQWSCPVLRSNSFVPATSEAVRMPFTLLRWRFMAPLDFVSSTATLYMAFGGELHHSCLYAMEQMLGCHTEACLVAPSVLQRYLATLPETRGESEVVFERVADPAELARIVSSYGARLGASEIRLAACGPHLWIRLLRPPRPPVDLLLHSFADLAARPGFSFPSAELAPA
jgi:hypothetical protein